jgi:hypothetical protein
MNYARIFISMPLSDKRYIARVTAVNGLATDS